MGSIPPSSFKYRDSVLFQIDFPGYMPNPPGIIGDGQPVLTDEMVLNLSKRLNNTLNLVTLATTGLKIPDYIVDGYINNNPYNIMIAALGVLKHWVRCQLNPYVAYTEMCKALTAAQMPHYIYEVLEKKRTAVVDPGFPVG